MMGVVTLAFVAGLLRRLAYELWKKTNCAPPIGIR
jgi:hypothetical protein